MNSNNVLRFSQLKTKVGLSRSTIYDLIKKEEFPRQIKLGQRAAGWIESEIDDWLSARASNRQ